MKEIKLSRGKIALVDDEDFDYLNQWKWFASKGRNTYYAGRSSKIKNNRWMHRLIMKTPENLQVDHIDHNGLNNQKSNLRNCTNTENLFNRNKNFKSKYKGVHYNYKKRTYIVQLKAFGYNVYTSEFKNAEKAARKYDEMAKIYHGEFANLNFK
jgi:hypothetical protein